MFGYFRFNNQYSAFKTKTIYKNYYCGTCFALDLHYGLLSRALLSYDVTTLAILMSAHKNPSCDRIKCLGKKKCKHDLFTSELWRTIAATNILLFAEKLRDDIVDENSFKARLLSLIFFVPIHKAKKDYPMMTEVIRSGYNRITDDEILNKDVVEIGNDFADMMTGILRSGFDPTELQVSYVREISRWLYFIDALDDYDKDVARKRFNPLVIDGVKYDEYVTIHYERIERILSDIYINFPTLKEALSDEKDESKILLGFLENTIPSITAMILNNIELPTLLHRKSGNTWRGGR